MIGLAAVWLAILLVAVAPAVAAPGPVWKVISYARPTNLLPGSPKNEEDSLAVNATGGVFTLTVAIKGSQVTPVTTAGIPYNASGAEVQAALNSALETREAGAVTVTGGPGGTSPYTITYGEGKVSAHAIDLVADGTALTGGAATALVTPVTVGEPAGEISVIVTNVGGVAAEGSVTPIAVVDSLPAGLTATKLAGADVYSSRLVSHGIGSAAMECASPPTLSCVYTGKVEPGDTLYVAIGVSVAPSGLAVGAVNRATVEGGGGASISVESPLASSLMPAEFGFPQGSAFVASSTAQAGAHPDLTTSFVLNTSTLNGTAGSPKDIRFDLPPGLVGSTMGLPTCAMVEALNFHCPAGSIVGIATAAVDIPALGNSATFTTPVYNVKPLPGEPAAFEFTALRIPVRLDVSLLSEGNYGVRVKASNITEVESLMGSSVTIWGVPADHNGAPLEGGIRFFVAGESVVGAPDSSLPRVALLSNPTQCSSPLEATLSSDPWTNPGVFQSAFASLGTPTGCDRLSFSSSFSMTPDTLEAGVPAGYTFDLHVPQSENPNGLVTPDVKNVKLTLPAGTVVSPSTASGLLACSAAQFGLHSGLPANCPSAAQIGEVHVKSPALAEQLNGQVYLSEPECGPCGPEDAQRGRMVRLFLQVQDRGEPGLIVKLAGSGQINQQTGQITTSFENNPQLPFDELELVTKGGSRAPLANPRTCGPAVSNLDLTPWSAPATPDSTPSYEFEIIHGCGAAQFAPSFMAGTSNIQAGEFSPFTVSVGRQDFDQYIGAVQVSTPPGLLGKLSAVTLCKEPQAAQGICGPESLIGHVQTLAGPGTTPFAIEGGQVFLTESYKGAPFGLSMIVPATAGPYTLAGTTGRGTVVVRAAISIDPHTAVLTVSSDPLPESLDGIPLQIRAANIVIDRSGFIFNPTNCEPMSVHGTITSGQGSSATVSNRFQVAACASLPFKPKFTVSTQAKTSKQKGASLDVKVAYPKGSTEANIRKVMVDLPKQLPSRLTTIQKACFETTFDANPALCPAASNIGTATAITPILNVPLTGPAYLVSHGNAAFPDLVIVLQGQGITLDLVGSIYIAKNGVTSSTFNTVPDAPISSFELKLPQGLHSALTTAQLPTKAHGNLCHTKLIIPITITAQNGAVIKQSTKITVTGCPKHKKPRRKKK